MIQEEQDLNNRVLIVDDEELNLDILEEYLEEEGFEVVTAENGKVALDIVQRGEDFSAVILDRMMPVMDGIEFLQYVKARGLLKNVPIIMQTAASAPEQIKQGIEAGVFYYLTKPYNKETLLAVVSSAQLHSLKQKKNNDEFDTQKRALGLLNDGIFKFQTLDEAKNLSYLIASFCPDPEKAIFGLNELTVNAIEHGNLGISYDEKKSLLEKNIWRDEVDKRVHDKDHKDKYATLEYEDLGDDIKIVISDCGSGFDFKKYMEIDSARMTDPNGRGIAITKMYAFDNMTYMGNGNIVKCLISKES